MRISDWSSDVCSSDLSPAPASGLAEMAACVAGHTSAAATCVGMHTLPAALTSPAWQAPGTALASLSPIQPSAAAMTFRLLLGLDSLAALAALYGLFMAVVIFSGARWN